jgi:hypothetical protein
MLSLATIGAHERTTDQQYGPGGRQGEDDTAGTGLDERP